MGIGNASNEILDPPREISWIANIKVNKLLSTPFGLFLSSLDINTLSFNKIHHSLVHYKIECEGERNCNQ